MTTPDWADEIAMAWKGGEIVRGELAADFRAAFLRGRVAGLREAAEIVMMGGASEYNDKVRSFARAAAATVSAQADKLESGS